MRVLYRLYLLLTLSAIALPQTSRLQWTQFEPRVITDSRTEAVTLNANAIGSVRLEFVTLGGAATVLGSTGGQNYRTAIPAFVALSGYQAGDGHNHIGYLDVYEGTTRVERHNLVINIRDRSMPDADSRNISAEALMSRHVLNLRDDTLHLVSGGAPPSSLLQKIYQILPDDFDFVAIVSQVAGTARRIYTAVRNDTDGIGVARQDSGSSYGSARHLQGIVSFPSDSAFDWAEAGALREIARRWCCYLSQPVLAPARPLWPLGDPAAGVMGYASAATGQPESFPYTMETLGDGSVRLRATGQAPQFTNLELYLMGLAATSEIGSLRIFSNQNQQDRIPSLSLQGPVETVTAPQITASDGTRRTPSGFPQTGYRVATVILSSGQLFGRDEIAFFDYMSGRGNSTLELTQRTGSAPRGPARPFHVATRQRASLSTTVCTACAISGVQPRIQANGITNGASFATGPVAPGEIVTIFGSGMGPRDIVTLRLNSDVMVDKSVAETRVLFDGVPAPVIYARGDQVSAVVPYSVAGKPRTDVQVEYEGRRSAVVTVNVIPASPALFAADSTGRGPGAILNQDYSVNTAANSAPRNSVVLLYGTGEGVTQPAGVDGAVAGNSPPKPVLPVTVRIGGQVAAVEYVGGAPGLVTGAFQINARIPVGSTTGPAVPVSVEINGVASQPGITVAVR